MALRTLIRIVELADKVVYAQQHDKEVFRLTILLLYTMPEFHMITGSLECWVTLAEAQRYRESR